MEQKIKQDIVIGYNIRKLRKRAGLTQEQTVARMQLMECNIQGEVMRKLKSAWQISGPRK